jgi:enoyl-CoA hydratase
MGGGCEMLQATDIRIAEEHATFGVPEVKRGLIAGAGSTMRLKRQIPYAVAMDMLITGRVLDAEEALRWGLVSHIAPSGAGMAKAREIADVICANGPLAVKAAKASVIATGWLPEAEAQPIEIGFVSPVMRSEDAKEGMKAFSEKRTPNFQGK